MANGPKRFSKPELEKVDVEILERHRSIQLLCKRCGQIWSPELKPGGGKFPRGYWRCRTEGCCRS